MDEKAENPAGDESEFVDVGNSSKMDNEDGINTGDIEAPEKMNAQTVAAAHSEG